MPATLSVKDIKAAFRPVEARVRLCLLGDIEAEINSLKEQLRLAQARADQASFTDSTVTDLEQRILDLQAEARAHEVEFVFRAIGRKAWTDLILAHPASDEQSELVPGIEYDLVAFPAAAMHASCVAPADADLDFWQEVNEEWNVGQVNRLWNACLAAQNGVAEAPKAPPTVSGARPASVRS